MKTQIEANPLTIDRANTHPPLIRILSGQLRNIRSYFAIRQLATLKHFIEKKEKYTSWKIDLIESTNLPQRGMTNSFWRAFAISSTQVEIHLSTSGVSINDNAYSMNCSFSIFQCFCSRSSQLRSSSSFSISLTFSIIFLNLGSSSLKPNDFNT